MDLELIGKNGLASIFTFVLITRLYLASCIALFSIVSKEKSMVLTQEQDIFFWIFVSQKLNMRHLSSI